MAEERLQPSDSVLPWRRHPGREIVRAAEACDLSLMTSLLDSGTPVDWADSQGRTALMAACEHHIEGVTKHDAAVRLLLERGADPNIANAAGHVAAFLAAFYGHESCLRELIAAGARLTEQNNAGHSIAWAATLCNGQTAGHKACKDLLVAQSQRATHP